MLSFSLIADFDFTGSNGCNSTYLELYDVAPDDTNIFIARYCGDVRLFSHCCCDSNYKSTIKYINHNAEVIKMFVVKAVNILCTTFVN